jgi:hypothetical protein
MIVSFIDRLKTVDLLLQSQPSSYWSTHPSPKKRISICNEILQPPTNYGKPPGPGPNDLVKGWADLNVDEPYISWETSWHRFEEIETILLVAQSGYRKDPKATLWHWAAEYNKTWPISQFLADSTARETLMALNGQGYTALEVARAHSNTAAINMLETYMIKNNLPIATAPSSSSSAKAPALPTPPSDAAAPSMPWGDRDLFFRAPTSDEQARLHAELETAPSVWGGESAYTSRTSKTSRFLKFTSNNPKEIAEELMACLDKVCMTDTSAEFQLSKQKKALIITLSNDDTDKSKNTALIKTLSQLMKQPVVAVDNVITLSWLDLKEHHVNLCLPVFNAYYDTLKSHEGVGLTIAQVEKILSNLESTLVERIASVESNTDALVRMNMPDEVASLRLQ